MKVDIGSYILDFFDGVEVGQGGPEACSLVIGDWLLEGRKFDPSPLLSDGKILLPMRKISFLNSGYVLTAIDPQAKAIRIISKIHGYMRLLRINGGSIEFATTAWGDATAFHAL